MEKKLTDEEIVKAIDKCFAMPMKCEDGCPYFNKHGRNLCVEDKRFYHDLKDLIHRLQKDYANLKERYVKVLDLNEKVIADQKAEIERLTEELKYYRGELL